MDTSTLPPSVITYMEKHKRVKRLIERGLSHAEIARMEGCSRQNISRVAKQIREWETKGWL